MFLDPFIHETNHSCFFAFPGSGISLIWSSGFGIREIQARLGIENIKGGGMPKITIGITGLYKILGGDYGIEKPWLM